MIRGYILVYININYKVINSHDPLLESLYDRDEASLAVPAVFLPSRKARPQEKVCFPADLHSTKKNFGGNYDLYSDI